MAETEEDLKSLLMMVKEDSEKDDLKLIIQKTNLMASGPITSWRIEGEKKTGSSDLFSFLGLQITVDGDFSHEIKWQVLPGRKTMTNLDSIL